MELHLGGLYVNELTVSTSPTVKMVWMQERSMSWLVEGDH